MGRFVLHEVEQRLRIQHACGERPKALVQHQKVAFPGLGRPDAAPEGIRFVIVSGEVAAENGRATGVMAGKTMDSFDSIYPTHSAKAGD